MQKLTTTFEKLKDYDACPSRYKHLAKQLGGIEQYGAETPITLLQILDANGVEDTLWALRTCKLTDSDKKQLRLLACDYAEHVLSIFEKRYPDDKRPRHCIETTRKYIAAAATLESIL